MNQIIRSSLPEAPEGVRSTFIVEEDIVPANTHPSAGRPPMRSALLRGTAGEDRLLIRDASKER